MSQVFSKLSHLIKNMELNHTGTMNIMPQKGLSVPRGLYKHGYCDFSLPSHFYIIMTII